MAASRAVQKRWDDYHASCACPIYDDPRPDEMYEFIMRNKMSGKEHTFLFHPGPRNDNFAIDMDGEPWKVGGFTLIFKELQKGLVKTKPGRIF